MNILLSGGIEMSEIAAKENNWQLFNRTNSSFIDQENEQVFNIVSEVDLFGVKVDKVYIHWSFFTNKNFFSILEQVQIRADDFILLEKINLNRNFQVIKKPVYLTKWQKFKAFLGGKFKIQWNGENI